MSLVTIVSVAIAGLLASTLLRGLHVAVLGTTFGRIDTLFTAAGIFLLLGGGYAMVNLRGVTLAKAGEDKLEAGAPSADAAPVSAPDEMN